MSHHPCSEMLCVFFFERCFLILLISSLSSSSKRAFRRNEVEKDGGVWEIHPRMETTAFLVVKILSGRTSWVSLDLVGIFSLSLTTLFVLTLSSLITYQQSAYPSWYPCMSCVHRPCYSICLMGYYWLCSLVCCWQWSLVYCWLYFFFSLSRAMRNTLFEAFLMSYWRFPRASRNFDFFLWISDPVVNNMSACPSWSYIYI